jgi:hypothetical protein
MPVNDLSTVRFHITSKDKLTGQCGFVKVHGVDCEAAFEMLFFPRGGEDDQ